jgi:hypothetical protein
MQAGGRHLTGCLKIQIAPSHYVLIWGASLAGLKGQPREPMLGQQLSIMTYPKGGRIRGFGLARNVMPSVIIMALRISVKRCQRMRLSIQAVARPTGGRPG